MYKSVGFLFLGALLGGMIMMCLTGMRYNRWPTVTSSYNEPKTSPVLQHALHVTLYGFALNTANVNVYQQWVQWHHDAYQPMIGTLDRERMYFESVFRDTVNAPGEIYWLAISGEGGASSTTSTSDIDKRHVEYMKQILIKGSGITLKTEFVLLPPFIEASIQQHQLTEK